MTVTVDLETSAAVDIDDFEARLRSPGTLSFVVEGTASPPESLLGAVAGSTLSPESVTLATDDRTVELPLEDGVDLRLETIDVDVRGPEPDAIPHEADDVGVPDPPSTPGDVAPGEIEFAVEGVVEGVSPDLVDDPSALRPVEITFSADDSVETDGGNQTDEIATFALLGFRITILRDGTVDVGLRGIDRPEPY